MSPHGAQFLHRRPSVFPACASQPQGSFTRIRPPTRHQGIEVLAQPSRIEISQCLRELPVRTSASRGKPVAQEAHDDGLRLGLGRLLVEERGAHVEIAPLASQPGQCTQALERAPDATPRRPARSHGQSHAQPARRDPDLVNRLFLTGLGARQVGKQPLHMLAHESRRGQFVLLAWLLHSSASLKQDSLAHKNADGLGV